MRKIVMLTIISSFFYIYLPAQTPSEKHETIMLTKAEFLKKVVNYEKNPKDWIYLGDKPCIIDFYAIWCGPCKRIAPILDELAQVYKGKLYIYKVDIDKEKELAQAFAIQSVPTIIFCPLKGKPTMSQGGLPKETFVKIIDEQLVKKKVKKSTNKK